jgi:acyl-CoA reductase-like NAD-dependent aldehyde dehydrogenase
LSYLVKESEEALDDEGVKTPLALMGKKSLIEYNPLGVVLVISPWNYPFYQAIVPITSSFVCGNATIFKPSEHTPLKGLLEGLFERAGFAKKWVQVVYGEGDVGKNLIDMKPDKVFFTGSVQTGKKIMAQAAKKLTPVELELGGKDAMIVFEDVCVDRAVAGALWGACTNSGQACTSVERLFVHQDIYENFKTKLVKKAEELEFCPGAGAPGGDPDGDFDIGPMTVDFQINTIREQIKDAESRGAKKLTERQWDGVSKMIPPILMEGGTSDMSLMTEETFGPVVLIQPFDSEENVIKRANASKYGLSASVWSKDLARARRVSRALKVGNVSINNVMLTEGNAALPFGGVKDSGFGRFKGRFGFHAFSNIKAVIIDKDSSKIEANWYPFTKEKYRLFTLMMLGLFRGGISGMIQFALAGLKLESYATKVGMKGRSKK